MKRSRLYRILNIITMIDTGYKWWSSADLADFFDVARRTIFRDLELIKELGVPIYYDHKYEGYQILDTFHFSPPDLNKEEAIALWLVSTSFQDKNFPYYKNLETAINKLYESLPDSLQEMLNKLQNRISIKNDMKIDLSIHKEAIEKIEEAVTGNNVLKVKYYSASRDKESWRKIDPYYFFIQEGVGYLAGYCHRREEIRLFRIDRMKSIEKLGENFNKPDDFSFKEYMGNSWGVERGEEMEIELIFKGRAAQQIQEFDLHPSQEIKKLKYGRILYRVRTGSREEIKSWILSHGSMVVVRKPHDLRREIEEEIKEMQKNY